MLTSSFFLLCACSPEAPQVDPATEARTAFNSYIGAINAGNVDQAADIYDKGEDFHWIERGAVQYASGEEAATSLRALSDGDGKAQMQVDDIYVTSMSDNTAVISTHFAFAMLDEAGEEQFGFDGWMTVGMVKRIDGWKIAAGQTGPGKSAREK